MIKYICIALLVTMFVENSLQDGWGKMNKANDMSQNKNSLDSPSDIQPFSHWRANEGDEVPEPADDDNGDFSSLQKQMKHFNRSPRDYPRSN
ncbi:unnamed protein product [Leptidea sinapis]|uniref:Uncharacterized protein n=1 Tax=Leptidea sinapis TaxID=189913 RepID=A0A5E4QXE5_9NEOP|nr:unnamed protein product [Leptidea sinapis]